MVDVTADYLDSKILQIFFPKSMEKEINPSTHYDYFILVCPELGKALQYYIALIFIHVKLTLVE